MNPNSLTDILRVVLKMEHFLIGKKIMSKKVPEFLNSSGGLKKGLNILPTLLVHLLI